MRMNKITCAYVFKKILSWSTCYSNTHLYTSVLAKGIAFRNLVHHFRWSYIYIYIQSSEKNVAPTCALATYAWKRTAAWPKVKIYYLTTLSVVRSHSAGGRRITMVHWRDDNCWENRSTTFSTTNPTWNSVGSNPGFRGEWQETNLLRHNTSSQCTKAGL